MSNLKNIATLLLAFLMLSIITHAQNASVDSTTIISETVFQPFLTDAFKIKDNPIIDDTTKIIPTLNYSFLDKQIPVFFDIDPIKPAKIKGEPLVKLYHGYTKVGFGTNTTPLVELYYNAKRSKTLSYGFFGKHFSSSGISGNDYSGYSDNELNVFAKHFSNDFTTYGKVGYTRNVNHFYGLSDRDTAIIRDANNVKQKLDKFDVAFSLARNFTDSSQFDYHINMMYHNIKDMYAVSENHFEMDGRLSKYHKHELYAIDIEMNYNKLINPLNQDNNLVLGLNPHISTSTDKWEFQVGVGLYLNSYPDTKFHFYPKAEFKYNIVEHIIIPYIGIDGGLVSNNLNNFYQENPFINTQKLATQNSNQKYNLYGGIRGSLSNSITFNTSYSQQKIEGMPLYIKDFSDVIQNKFILTYDTVNLSVITGELTYQKLEKIKILFGGKYYNYNVKNELKAWHKPDYEISLSGIYDLSDKIIVRADFYHYGKQYAKTLNTTTLNNITTTVSDTKTISNLFDINLGLEYRYTKKLSAFIQFNNIMATPYKRWDDYPTQKFGVLGGLTYSF